MGIINVPLVVGNPFNQATETVEAMVDTGAIYSMMPASLLHRLGIDPVETVTFYIANGETVDYPTSWASFFTDGRLAMARVIFGPEDEYLMGATTLEDMRLMADPANERLVPARAPLM